jgi:AraC family transcriptional regulator
MTDASLAKIRRFVGGVAKEQLRYVDSFIGEDVALFMPVGGPCFYALSPMHSHPSYMFVLPFNDQTSVEMKGGIITAEHGKLFCLSPGIVHNELASDYPPRYIAILITKGFFERQLSLYPAGEEITFQGESFHPSPELLSLLKRFMREAGDAKPGRGAVLHGLSLEICHSIIRGIFRFSEDNDGVSSRIEIDRVIEYLHSHLERKISVEDMAAIARMAPSHFARIFKREIGNTPMDYLSRIRMERVKKLLLAGDKSITEIAIECGFRSSSYLSACFYKKFRISPSAYCGKDGISKKKDRIAKDRPR